MRLLWDLVKMLTTSDNGNEATSTIQGDTSDCAKPPVDFKTKVPELLF